MSSITPKNDKDIYFSISFSKFACALDAQRKLILPRQTTTTISISRYIKTPVSQLPHLFYTSAEWRTSAPRLLTKFGAPLKVQLQVCSEHTETTIQCFRTQNYFNACHRRRLRLQYFQKSQMSSVAADVLSAGQSCSRPNDQLLPDISAEPGGAQT